MQITKKRSNVLEFELSLVKNQSCITVLYHLKPSSKIVQ